MEYSFPRYEQRHEKRCLWDTGKQYKSRAQLFKTNNVVRQRIVKTLIIKYGIYANIFAKKIWVAFAFARATRIFFQQKYLWIRYCTTRTFNIFSTNELVKLMMLWTTGPWSSSRDILSDQELCSNLSYSTVPSDSISRQWRSWSGCKDVQADLGFCYPQIFRKTHFLMEGP